MSNPDVGQERAGRTVIRLGAAPLPSDNPRHSCGALLVDAYHAGANGASGADWWCPACDTYLNDQDPAIGP